MRCVGVNRSDRKKIGENSPDNLKIYTVVYKRLLSCYLIQQVWSE